MDPEQPFLAQPRGAVALVGAWSDMGDEQIDALVAHIYAERERDTGRRVQFEELCAFTRRAPREAAR